MAIKSLKDKISNMASGEILGETDKEREDAKKERSPKPRKERPKKKEEPKIKREKPKRERKKKEPKVKPKRKDKQSIGAIGGFFKKKDEEPKVEDKNVTHKEINKPEENKVPVEDSIEGYEDVLAILGIKENLNPEADFESSDLDYIEFSQTTPLGFDFQEVTDFISRVKYTLNKYENALAQRNKDLIVVASEVKKVEQRMVEANQAKELERMVGGMTEEERLIEENLDLSIEVNDLKNKLIASGKDGDVGQLKKQIELLQSENEMLKSGIFPAKDIEEGESLPSLNESTSKNDVKVEFGAMPDLDDSNYSGNMPNLNEVESDPLDDIISDLGGMYDEER